MQLIFAYFPIVLLVYLMTRKNAVPSSQALPFTALVTYVVMLVVFQRDPNLVHASVLKGLLVAWTPILIIAGAIFLFKTMERSGALAVIRTWLNGVSSNKVAQLMIVGWAFPFLIEGASGFGTPAALAAPVLVGLGFPPVRVAILSLIMNSVPVSFGAVGTPTWFGFSALTLTNSEILEIGFKTAIMNSAASLLVVGIALSFVVKPKSIFKNWLFILASILFTVIPYLIIARFNYEFPSLIGGFIGLTLTALLAKSGFGLSSDPVEEQEEVDQSDVQNAADTEKVRPLALAKAAFPLWGTIVLLVITRIPALGIKALLTAAEPSLSLGMGSLGVFRLSPSLVVGLEGIFNTSIRWSHNILYVPSLIPFVLISMITFWIYRVPGSKQKGVLSETIAQMRNPVLALLGALVFVELVMMGGTESAVALIGNSLADLTGDNWQYFSAYLGAVGSFFAGSNTISNLTFGGIQDSIAQTLGLNRTTILAMQSVGGAMGNMVCINNIVAVASVLGIGNKEGYILKRTVLPVILYGLLAALVSVLL